MFWEKCVTGVLRKAAGIKGEAEIPYTARTSASNLWRGIRVDVLTFLRSGSNEGERMIRDFDAFQLVMRGAQDVASYID